MKKFILLFTIIPFMFYSCDTELEIREETKIVYVDHQWKFSTGDDSAWAAPDFDDSSWTTISINSLWENQGFAGYDGYAWYRKQTTVPADYKSNIEQYDGIIIEYDSADDVDELFFNGYSVGMTGSFPPNYEGKHNDKRKYIVPAQYVKYDEPNTIAIRVFDNGGGGGILTERFILRTMNKMDGITYSVNVPAHEWVFMEGEAQQIDLALNNTHRERVKLNAILVLKTDKHAPLDSIVMPVELNSLSNQTLTIPFNLPEPGFYRCTVYIERDGVTSDAEKFNIGYEPEKIISPLDAKGDFEAFWQQTREELDKVNPNYKVTLVPERSQGNKNMYKVEMKSFGDVDIMGYYAVPKNRWKTSRHYCFYVLRSDWLLS